MMVFEQLFTKVLTYPTSLNALGIVNAPVPTMRLNIYTSPVVGEY